MKNNKIQNTNIFNSVIEYALRAIIVLDAFNGKSCDLQKLIYLDFLLIHSGDFEDSLISIHPKTPYRYGELFVKRDLLQKGLKLMCSKQLIEIKFTNDGIEYSANKLTNAFLTYLDSSYYKKLDEGSKWLYKKYGESTNLALKELLENNKMQYEFDREYFLEGDQV